VMSGSYAMGSRSNSGRTEGGVTCQRMNRDMCLEGQRRVCDPLGEFLREALNYWFIGFSFDF